MNATINAGDVFGRLTVTSAPQKIVGQGKARRRLWPCLCSCGNTTWVKTTALRSGNTKSCGCYKKDINGKSSVTHGASNTPEFNVWLSMKARCNNPRSKDHKYYFDRGIRVCERWMDFTAFIADMGPRPTLFHTVERNDNDGNYEPGNCRWATRAEQNANKRKPIHTSICGLEDHLAGKNLYISPDGVRHCRACNTISTKKYQARRRGQ